MTNESMWSIWYGVLSSEFFDYSIKSLMLSAVVLTAVLLTTHTTVGRTSWICRLGFGGLLVLALSYYFVPVINIPMLPAFAGSQSGSSEQSSAALVSNAANELEREILFKNMANDGQVAESPGRIDDRGIEHPVAARADSTPKTADTVTADEPAGARPIWPIAESAAIVWHRPLSTAWIGGLAAVTAWWLIGFVQLTIRLRRTEPATAKMMELCDRLREKIGLPNKVAVRIADDDCMPFVYGGRLPRIKINTKAQPEQATNHARSWRSWYMSIVHQVKFDAPTIVLPAESRAWSESKCVSILLHELAHVRLGDLAVKKWIRLVSAFHWWNPLAVALIRLHGIACERACDQMVVGSGIRTVDYADHLLQVVANCRRVRHAPATFGNSNHLRARITAIVATTQPTEAVKTGVSTLAGLVILATVLPISAARLAARPPMEIPSAEAPGPIAGQQAADEPVRPSADAAANDTRTIEGGMRETYVVSVSGKVVDDQDLPLTDAAVYLVLARHARGMDPTSSNIVDETRTDENGRFAFDGRPDLLAGLDPKDIEKNLALIVTKADYGIGWQILGSREVSDVSISLPKEHMVSGTVVDSEGSPIAGAKVGIWQLFESISLDEAVHGRARTIDLAHLTVLSSTTDADGSFSLTAVPPNTGVGLAVEHDAYAPVAAFYTSVEAQKQSAAVNRDKDGHRIVGPEKILEIHGDEEVQFVMHQRQRITGIVLSADDAVPVPNAEIAILAHGMSLRQTVLTNAEGRFQSPRFDSSDLSPPLRVQVRPPVGFLSVDHPVRFDQDQAELSTTIRVPRGFVVSGKVLDAEHGRPLGGAKVALAPMEASAPNWAGTSYATSQADGTFQATVSSGRFRVFPMGPIPGYFAPQPFGERKHSDVAGMLETIQPPERFEQTITIPANGLEAPIEVRVHRGLVIRGVVRDAEGLPVEGAVIEAGRPLSPSKYHATSDAQGQFELSGLFPGLNYSLVATHAGRGIGGRMALKIPAFQTPVSGDILQTLDTDIVAVKAGRVIGQVFLGDQPYGGLTVELSGKIELYENSMMSRGLASGTTDAEGRFELNDVMPGPGLRLRVASSTPGWSYQGRSFSLADGETYQYPTIRFDVPDREITGRVVDPANRPLGGIRVSISSDLSSTPEFHGQTATSDPDGMFVFRQLPRTPLRIDASLSNFELHTVSATLRLSATDDRVRVVLDPRLNQQAPATSSRKD